MTMQKLFGALQSVLRRTIVPVMLLALITVSTWVGFVNQPSFAATVSSTASNSISTEEKTNRAYDEYSEAAGIQEDVYQQRLKEGQDPEKMPKPYKRIKDSQGKEVPETSFVEKSVSKVRGLVDNVSGQ
jgi:hypothetical protein